MTAVEVAARRLTVKTDAGPPVEVRAEEQTVFLKARPGSSTLDDAAPARLEDVAVGDRVLARGRLADDKASLAARQVVVMTRGDITAKQNAERSADGNRFVPEQIVFGTFRTVSGAVVRIDARGELPPELMDLGMSLP